MRTSPQDQALSLPLPRGWVLRREVATYRVSALTELSIPPERNLKRLFLSMLSAGLVGWLGLGLAMAGASLLMMLSVPFLLGSAALFYDGLALVMRGSGFVMHHDVMEVRGALPARTHKRLEMKNLARVSVELHDPTGSAVYCVAVEMRNGESFVVWSAPQKAHARLVARLIAEHFGVEADFSRD